MSKADKMLRSLKYVVVLNNDEKIIFASVKNNITFNLITEKVETKKEFISSEVESAINLKKKELGWFDE